MARLAYPDPTTPELSALADRIKTERGGKLINLYGMLLHSPVVADGWLTFLTAIRQKCSLSARTRELVIMRIAVINGADYEFQVHIPFAIEAGLTQDQLINLRSDQRDGFTEIDLVVLDYTDAMTRNVRVSDAVFQSVKEQFSEQEIVELTATIAAYNMVSRFLEALKVDHD